MPRTPSNSFNATTAHQRAHLMRIKRLARASYSGAFSPGTAKALLVAGATGMLFLILDVPSSVSALSGGALSLLPLFSAGLAFYLVYRKTGKRDTWEATLDRCLAAYSPTNIEAYRRLQEDTREQRQLHPRLVEEWADTELTSILSVEGAGYVEESAFLQKKV